MCRQTFPGSEKIISLPVMKTVGRQIKVNQPSSLVGRTVLVDVGESAGSRGTYTFSLNTVQVKI
jgi:hypothetical protein